MNSLPVTVQAIADTTRAAKSLDNLTRNRQVVLAATFDAKSIAAANKPLGAIKRSADEFEKSMQAANARVLAFGTSVAVIEGMRRSFLALIQTTRDVEKALIAIESVGADSLKKAGITIDQFGAKLFKVAKETGQTFKTTSDAALEFSRQGLGLEETLKRTSDALVLTRLSGLDATASVEALTAVYNTFKGQVSGTNEVLQKLVAVDNASAASMADLAEGVKRVGSIAQFVGQDIDEVIASITVLQEVTARGGANIGNSFKTILERGQRLESLKILENAGIATKDAEGKIKPTIQLYSELAKVLETPALQGQKVDIARQLAGNFQINSAAAFLDVLGKIVDGSTRYEDVLKTSRNASDEATKQNEKFAQSLDTAFNTAGLSIERVLNSLGKIGVRNPLEGLLKGVSEIGEGFSSFIDGEEAGSGLARAFVKGFGGILLGPTGIFVIGGAIYKIVKDFGVFAFEAAKGFLSLNKTAKDQELIQKSILTTISQMPSILNGIENTESGRLLLAQRVSAEYERQLSLSAMLNNMAKGASPIVSRKFKVTESGLAARSANGYLPNLISSEMKDVKNGVGGANPNSKVVVMPNFPFGGGKKGLMVANSSEMAMKMGDGYGILNPNMMGKRAAAGFYKPSSVAAITKSGGSAKTSDIEGALNLLAQSSNLFQLFTGDLRKEVRTALKAFDLNERSLNELTDAFILQTKSAREEYALSKQEVSTRKQLETYRKAEIRSRLSNVSSENYRSLVGLQAADRLAQEYPNSEIRKLENEISILRSQRESSKAAGYASSMAPPASLAAIPYTGLGFSGSTSAKSSSSFGSFAPSQATTQRILETQASPRFDRTSLERMSGSILAQRNYEANPTAAFGGSQRIQAQGSLSPLAEAAEKTKGSFESFGIKAIAISAAVDFATAQFRGQSKELDKFADALSTATIAATGFLFLNNSKGLTAGKAFAGFGDIFSGAGQKIGGGKIGKIIDVASSGISSFASGISTAAKGLVRFLPIIGQIGLAGFAINEFSKVFSDKSLFDRIYQAFGGLSDSAEKAKQRFNDVANQLFSSEGGFNPKTREERSGLISSVVKSLALNEKARSLGVSTGENSQETARNIFNRTLSDILKGTKTGESATTTGFAPGISPTVKTTTFDKTFADLSQSAVSIIQEQVQNVISGDINDLRDIAKNAGLSVSGKTIDQASIDELRTAIGSSLLEGYKASQEFLSKKLGTNASLSSVLETNIGQLGFANFAKDFLGSNQKAIVESGEKSGPAALSPETQKNIQKVQDEIRSLVIEGTISSLESQIRALEFKASGDVSESDKNSLLNTAANIQKRVFSNQRQQALTNIQSRAAEIRSSDKTPQEIESELKKLKVEYTNQRLAINANESAAKRETDERNRAANSLRNFNSSISSIEGFISTLGVRSSFIDAEGQRLRAQSSNPSLGIGAQEDYQRRANSNAIDSLESQRAIIAAERSAEFLQNERIVDPDQRIAAEKKSADNFISRNIAIQGEIDAINESTSQIGATKASFTSLNDAITQFTRSLGESRGQNQFNLLQATDASSIVQGLIGEKVYDSAGGKGGAELVSFIADQNALLNEQFKIRIASSESERIELERQYELTTQLLEIKNSNVSASQKQAQIEAAINANLEKRRTFSSGVQDATAVMRDRVNNFGNEFGKTTANAFRDGLSDAIKAAVSQTSNLKDALLDIALAFANKLRDAAIDNLVDSLMGGSKGSTNSGVVGGVLNFVGSLFNGGVQAKAAGGMVRGGSGNKDDVPTLLMGGEYIIPKNIVNSYGKTFFDRIRDGSVGKMASGGYFAPGVRGQGSIIGKDNLLDFATQTATNGSQDVRQTLRNGAGMVSLEPESLRMSNFARFGDSPIVQATQDAKDQAFGLYLDQLGQEKQYQDELANYYRELEEAAAAQKKAKKDKQKQLLLSLASAVIGGAISSYSNDAKTSAKSGETRFSSGRIRGISERPFSGSGGSSSFSSGKGFSSSAFQGSSSFSSYSPQFDYREMVRQITAGIANGGSDFFKQYDLGINRGGSYGSSLLLPSTSYTPYRNSGGYGNGDTRQAMLSKDEFVLNSSASKNLGDKALYALNNGSMPSGESDDSAILAKLDELIQKTSGSNSVSVTVNTGKDGEQSSSEGDSNTNEKNRMLAEKVKTTVLQILRDEKRPGGILTK